VLDPKRDLAAEKPYVGREYGVARYDRIVNPNFGTADEYFNRTKAFWDDVRDEWVETFRKQPTVTLRAQVDQAGLFVPLFEHADKLAAGEKPQEDGKALIQKTLQDMAALAR
jgi:hypothetical protein